MRAFFWLFAHAAGKIMACQACGMARWRLHLDDSRMSYDHENWEMQHWLRRHGHLAGYFIVQHLNWDHAKQTVFWIIEQQQCDRATAAYAFWLSGPTYRAKCMLRGDKEALSYLYNTALMQDVILDRWSKGLYADRGWPVPNPADIRLEIDDYRKLLGDNSGERDPLEIPDDLYDVFGGNPPERPDYANSGKNDKLWSLFANLGSYPDRVSLNR